MFYWLYLPIICKAKTRQKGQKSCHSVYGEVTCFKFVLTTPTSTCSTRSGQMWNVLLVQNTGADKILMSYYLCGYLRNSTVQSTFVLDTMSVITDGCRSIFPIYITVLLLISDRDKRQTLGQNPPHRLHYDYYS